MPDKSFSTPKTQKRSTDGAASAEPSLLELCRVATEVDKVNRGSSESNGEGLARQPKGKSKLAFRHCRVATEVDKVNLEQRASSCSYV